MGIITYADSPGEPEIFNSDDVEAGLCIGVHNYAAFATDTLTYPSLAGATVMAFSAQGYGGWGVTVDYALGYPRVNVASAAFARTVVVWTDTPPSLTPGTGIRAINGAGGMVLSPEGFGLYYLGLATFHASVANSGGSPEVCTLGYTTMRYTSANPIVPIVALEAGRHSIIKEIRNIGSNIWEIDVAHVTSSTDANGLRLHATPTVHVFGRLTSVNTTPEFSIKQDGPLYAYDLFRDDLLITAAKPVFSLGTTLSAAVPSMSSYGVFTNPNGTRYDSDFNGFGYDVEHTQYMWTRTSDISLSRNEIVVERFQEDGAIINDLRGAITPIVVDLTGL
jgi:hypothetical protein